MFARVSLLTVIVLLLVACSAAEVKITEGHLAKLQSHFVGREFVFRTDWYERFAVYRGRPTHLSLVFAGDKPSDYVKNAAQRPGDLLARAGTVARITGIRPESNYKLRIYYATQQGGRGDIALINFSMTDQVASAPWIEEQLGRETIEFLTTREEIARQMQTSLPAPPPEPELTSPGSTVSPPRPAPSSEPAINRLVIRTDPTTVRHGETLKLELDYSIDTAGRSHIPVTESRNLLFEGKALPGYPKTRQANLSQGAQVTSFRQKIPAKAKPGQYTYEGEVCIEQGCISRLIRFTIAP